MTNVREERPGRTHPLGSLFIAVLMAITLGLSALPSANQAAAAPRTIAGPAASTPWAVSASTTTRVNVRMRVYVKLKKKLKRSKKATVTLASRQVGSAGYAVRVTFKRKKATLQRLSHDSSGRVTSLGGPVVLVTKIKPKRRVYLQTELVEVAGGTRIRVRGRRAGKSAKTVDYLDRRSGRPTQAGTTSVSVRRSAKVKRPKVRQLSVSQPTGTTSPVVTPAAPKPVTPSAPNLPPNPNAGHSGWSGRVSKVADGDTLFVALDGSGKTVQVRNAGIQAMEAGQCGAARATAAMASLAPVGSRVLLTARYASSTSEVGGVVRLLRFIYVLKDGKWLDTQLALLQKGEVLWYPIPPEYANSAKYRAAMERAAATKSGMFNPTRSCGTAGSATPRMWINYDGDGDENVDVNSEYIRVLNPTSATLDVSGWWIRDGSQVEKRMPAGAVIKPGGTLTLHVGRGADAPTRGRLFWGWSSPRYQNTINPATGRRAADIHGNAAYLFDPRGNVRALTTYPCSTCGAHPLKGRVRLAVQPTGADERATVTNSSSDAVDLSHLVLQARGSIYEIAPGTRLNPGEALTVRMRTGTNSRLVQYWGKKAQYNLPDGGYEMRLRDGRDVPIACVSWGSGAC